MEGDVAVEVMEVELATFIPLWVGDDVGIDLEGGGGYGHVRLAKVTPRLLLLNDSVMTSRGVAMGWPHTGPVLGRHVLISSGDAQGCSTIGFPSH